MLYQVSLLEVLYQGSLQEMLYRAPDTTHPTTTPESGIVAGDVVSGIVALDVVTLQKLRWRIRGCNPELVESVRIVYGGMMRIDIHSEVLKYYEQIDLILQSYEAEVDIENLF